MKNTHGAARIIIDTDPGIDDILALLLAFASPEVQVEAVTTVSGNVDVEQTTRNALAFLEALGHGDVPVARGSRYPLVREPIDAGYYHGQNGIGEVILPPSRQSMAAQNAAELIVETVKAAPNEITLVAIGPLTNLALALRSAPEIARMVREVVIMGGALRSPGNVTPAGEFNIAADPHAAHVVLHAGWPIRLVALDVTNQVGLCREHIVYLSQTGSPIWTPVGAMLEYNLTKFADSQGFALHDPLCLASVFRPDFITWEEVYVAVELTGQHTLGETVAYFPGYGVSAPLLPNVRASVQVDREGFLQWFVERIYQYLVQRREKTPS